MENNFIKPHKPYLESVSLLAADVSLFSSLLSARRLFRRRR